MSAFPSKFDLPTMVSQIQNLPPESRERGKLINELIKIISSSKNIAKLRRWQYLSNFDDLYAQALADTFIYIIENINKYDPKRADVLAWVNKTLYFKFRDIYNKEVRPSKEELSLDAVNYDVPASSVNEEVNSLSLRDFIQKDPEGLLNNTKVNYQNKKTEIKESLSLQMILLLRLEGKTWEEIQLEYGISITSASSFLQRNLKKTKIRNYFHKYLKDV